MGRLEDIPVRVESVKCGFGPSGLPNRDAVLALLNEIDAKLSSFIDKGEESTLDLRMLVRSSPDISLIHSILGRGEVAAVVTTSGNSEITETSVPCLWWVIHYDVNNHVLGTFLEIAEIPNLLRSDRGSVAHGLALLRARGADLIMPVRPTSMP
ncbi:hydrogenase expression/formation C-terminal domain-containing protein [Methyloterricola oryzae]|uniref:hydrogenase expression/formation C-terminal domain-containing protein n=1 Tax=Methyloterricola oryzae TaxID=1495050 RepID=UPI00069C583B|nr:hydrogenase expression/formation C-terminal domain-containing protein [Methyloterricola oryzae]